MTPNDPVLISYAGPDLMWAEWVSQQLQRAGCAVEARVSAGGTAALAAAGNNRRHVVILSSSYLRPAPGEPAGIPASTLIPVIVGRCDLPPWFWRFSPVSLYDVADAQDAARRLLTRVLGRPEGLATSGTAEASTRFPGHGPRVWSASIPARNMFFTGRDEMLQRLRRRITTDVAAIVPHSLQGLAGVGKTQLAVEYAHRFAADYDVVWWIPSDKPAVARKALADLAIRLDRGRPQSEISELVEAAKDALRMGAPYDRWLLIFDNAGSPEAIRPLLPSGSGHVLVTSRDQAWDRFADAMDVDVYTRAESIGFLLHRLPDLTEPDAETLAAALGDMPLALEHAAGWLTTTQAPLADYLSLLSKRTAELLESGGLGPYETPVALTWIISMNQLRETNAAAARMLDLCAFIGPDPIDSELLLSAPRDFLPPGLSDALRSTNERLKIIEAIRSYSLARLHKNPGREPSIQQHRLVQAVVRDQTPADQQAAYRRFAHQILAAADPQDPAEPGSWAAYDALLPHVLSSAAITDPDPAVRSLVIHVAQMLNMRGEYQSALDISVAAIKSWSEVLDDIDTDLILARRNQGNSLRGLARFAETLLVDRETYDLVLTRRGPDHPDTLVSISGLSSDYRRLGHFAEARELDEHAVAVSNREWGPDDVQTLRHEHNYAVDLRLTGEFEAALAINERGHVVRTRVLGPDTFPALFSINDVARDLRELGQCYESLTLQENTYARYREIFGEDSPDTIRAMKNLAVSRRKAGRYEEGADLSADVLERHIRKFGEHHPETLAAFTNYSCDLRGLGRYQEARGYAESALRGFGDLLGENHPYAGMAAVNLAPLLRLAGDAATARTLNTSARELLGTSFGHGHRYTLSAAVNLASDLAALGDPEAARELDEASLAGLREACGPDHPYTLASAVNLALDLRALGARDAFHELQADTLARYERTLGTGHPEAQAAAARERAVCDIEPPPV